MRNWEEIKLDGSDHYKGSRIEPIDFYKDIPYKKDLSALQVFALCNVIKYAYRLLTKGVNEKDLIKIIHYAEIAGAATEKAG